MTMKAFLSSNAGIGTLGVVVACLIIVFPVVGTWMIAAALLIFAIKRLMDAIDEIGNTRDDDHDHENDTPVAESVTAGAESLGHAPPFDVEAAMAEMANQAARAVRVPR